MRPSFVSSSTRRMFFRLQMLFRLRGEKRIVHRSSSTRFVTPSIHPKARASSRASS
jgi:hypothetical protein